MNSDASQRFIELPHLRRVPLATGSIQFAGMDVDPPETTEAIIPKQTFAQHAMRHSPKNLFVFARMRGHNWLPLESDTHTYNKRHLTNIQLMRGTVKAKNE